MTKTRIKKVLAREVFTTKGTPAIEVDITVADGSTGRAAAPGGSSRGRFEPVDLVDGDLGYFDGLGVSRAIAAVHSTIAPTIIGKDAADQEGIDQLLVDLDGTRDRSRLGGNTIVAVSIACAKAAARALGIELFTYFGNGRVIPAPFVYVMFGGPAYVGMQRPVCDVQEYALLPLRAATYKEGYLTARAVYQRLAEWTAGATGHPPARYSKLTGIPIARFDSNEDAFAFLTHVIAESGLEPGLDMGIHVDVAASQLYREGAYHLACDGQILSCDAMVERLAMWCERFPILSLEDPLQEEDWESWRRLTRRIGHRVQVLGDDLFVSNAERLQLGIDAGAANGIVIKPNQAGTLSETFDTIALAKQAGYRTVISPRSGELWDPYLVHLCVGKELGQGKLVGAYSSGESNLNEILRISDAPGAGPFFIGSHLHPGRPG